MQVHQSHQFQIQILRKIWFTDFYGGHSWKFLPKNVTFSAIKSFFAPQECGRITSMNLNESQNLEVMDEDIRFEICGNLCFPYDSSNDENWKIWIFSFLNAISEVQRMGQSHFYCSAELGWSNACIENSNVCPGRIHFKGSKTRKKYF